MASARIEKLIDSLKQSRSQLNAALDRVPEGLWEQQIYDDGAKWTLRQLLIHLMVVDQGQANVIRGVAEGKNLIPEDYDINRYNSSSVGKRQAVTIEEARASLAQSHASLLEWLNQIDDSVLDKEGRHAILQTMTVERMLEVMAQHESGHTRDIEAMIAQNA
jgi:uncharacterized damage-inducible protein DinB